MKRTTVKIPDELDARLRHAAALRGTTLAEVVREALEAHLGVDRRTRLEAAVGASGRSDISARIDEILRDEWPDRRS